MIERNGHGDGQWNVNTIELVALPKLIHEIKMCSLLRSSVKCSAFEDGQPKLWRAEIFL